MGYDELSARVRAALDRRKADLELLLDRQITAAEYAQEALMNELVEKDAARGRFVTSDVVRKLQQVASTLEIASRTRIALAKAEKLLSGRLTPTEVLAAARKRVMAVPYRDRAAVLREMIEAHLAEFVDRERSQTNHDTALSSLMAALEKREPVDAPVDDKDGD